MLWMVEKWNQYTGEEKKRAQQLWSPSSLLQFWSVSKPPGYVLTGCPDVGMRTTNYLCPGKLGGWVRKQPALYFIHVHSDKAISLSLSFPVTAWNSSPPPFFLFQFLTSFRSWEYPSIWGRMTIPLYTWGNGGTQTLSHRSSAIGKSQRGFSSSQISLFPL